MPSFWAQVNFLLYLLIFSSSVFAYFSFFNVSLSKGKILPFSFSDSFFIYKSALLKGVSLDWDLIAGSLFEVLIFLKLLNFGSYKL